MSASYFTVNTILFSDPSIATEQQILTVLNLSVSLPPLESNVIQTLSTTASTAGQNVAGLLYTPDLLLGDPCINASAPYVPSNVTRQGSLPNEDYDLIGVAPWLSPTCTLNYLAAAQQDPINGFIFFTPGVNDTGVPPGPDSVTWDLGDGGAWKTTNRYPVYVIDGALGNLLLLESAQYSGNMTSVPFGHKLVAAYDPRDYVRLRVNIILSTSSSLPSLWVFLLIVLGILLGVILVTSVLMHCMQRNRRRTLRQRIINGEVDLEALGIQRLIVPQELLNRMPVFEYGTGRSVTENNSQEHQHTDQKLETDVDDNDASAQSRSRSPKPTDSLALSRPRFHDHINQTTCAICLDDFIATTPQEPGCAVRQLPCHHIFHPECVDNFLRENSSLCPMCKRSALPKGYCPRVITNAMVRRERTVRRIRERIDDSGSGTIGSSYHATPNRYARMRAHVQMLRPMHRRASMTELSSTAVPETQQTPMLQRDQTPPPDPSRRREWARQRAIAMLGRQRAPDAAERTAHHTRWRKFLGGVFPGID